VAAQSQGAAPGRRHGVVAFAFGAMFLGYTDRVNLAVAAVAMRSQLHWSQSAKGLVLAGFFVGYFLFQVISGSLAQRFGGKRVLTVAVMWWSLCALLTPLAATASLALLIAARIGLGVGEAAVLPACYDLFSRWSWSAALSSTIPRSSSELSTLRITARQSAVRISMRSWG
jgi:MFS family permease